MAGIDGYGYNLLKNYGNLTAAQQDGSIILPIQTVFPSKTFPNFFALATGLHPSQHGLIANKFYNKKQETVSLGMSNHGNH